MGGRNRRFLSLAAVVLVVAGGVLLSNAYQKARERWAAKALQPISGVPGAKAKVEPFMEQLVRDVPPRDPANPQVRIETDRGSMVVELFASDMPNTVRNFLYLVRNGYYRGKQVQYADDLIAVTGSYDGSFHPVNATPGYAISAESGGTVNRPLYVGMYMGGPPIPGGGSATEFSINSVGSMFYIVLSGIGGLDGRYSPMGQVLTGRNVPFRLQKGDRIKDVVILNDAGIAGEPVKFIDFSEVSRDIPPRSPDNPVVELTTTKGALTVELFKDLAPNTTKNFLSLIRRGFYAERRFLYADPYTFVEAGSPDGTILGNAGYLIPDEPTGLVFTPGMVAMAKRRNPIGGAPQDPQQAISVAKLMMPNSASCIFLISTGRNIAAAEAMFPFGQVIRGRGVLYKLTPNDMIQGGRVISDRGVVGEPTKLPLTTVELPPEFRDRPVQKDTDPIVVIKTDVGNFRVELFKDEAPLCVQNFLYLIRRGFYNSGKMIFRSMVGQVVASGDPTNAGGGHAGYMFRTDTGLTRHFTPGALAMLLRREAGGTASSEFAISLTTREVKRLVVPVFGQVLNDLERLTAITDGTRLLGISIEKDGGVTGEPVKLPIPKMPEEHEHEH